MIFSLLRKFRKLQTPLPKDHPGHPAVRGSPAGEGHHNMQRQQTLFYSLMEIASYRIGDDIAI